MLSISNLNRSVRRKMIVKTWLSVKKWALVDKTLSYFTKDFNGFYFCCEFAFSNLPAK